LAALRRPSAIENSPVRLPPKPVTATPVGFPGSVCGECRAISRFGTIRAE
jgi:hypothetical protein